MHVFKFTVLSALVVTGLAIATSTMVASFAAINDDSSQAQLVGNNSNRRNTSYRGSGRREIVALPTPVLDHDA